MPDSYPKFKAAVAQLAPSFLNREETVEIACKAIEEAGREGAELIAFPESFIPGYPYWIWLEPPFASAAYFRNFFKNSVEVPSPATKLLCQSAKKAKCHVVMGMTLREGGTPYNAMLFIDKKGEIMGCRRKLVPTVAERTVWGRGDGSDLTVYNTDLGKIGGLICGENNMFLVKYALLAKGEQVHIANFPGTPLKEMTGFNDAIDLILRSYAILGQIFILNAINYVSEEMLDTIFDSEQKKTSYREINNGGASIISPRGTYIAKPVLNKEMIVYADIDLEMIIDAKWASDCTGHYARPDITRLVINEEKYRIHETTPALFHSSHEGKPETFEDDLKKLTDAVEKSRDKNAKHLLTHFIQKYCT